MNNTNSFGNGDQSSNQTGNNISSKPSSWVFKGISKNFDKHISQSVPLYRESHQLVCSLTDFFIGDSSVIVDIGSSTGNLIKDIAMRQSHITDINFYLVDEVLEMIEYSRNLINEKQICQAHIFNYINESIVNYELPVDVSIISAMYTIQFISPSIRQVIIDKIYNSLSWGGAFFFFEKTNGNDARFHEILLQNYEDIKIKNGFSLEEIKSKQLALRGVLKPFSSAGNLDLLKRAGFVDIQIIFRYGMFEGILAIK